MPSLPLGPPGSPWPGGGLPLWPWELEAVEPLSPDGGLEAPAVDGAELLDDGLLELWLLDESLLELWLLDDWELEDELLCEELLELELELEELGGCGIVGVVGLLALGQPVSTAQAPTTRPS